jgi:hypothetical protein
VDRTIGLDDIRSGHLLGTTDDELADGGVARYILAAEIGNVNISEESNLFVAVFRERPSLI